MTTLARIMRGQIATGTVLAAFLLLMTFGVSMAGHAVHGGNCPFVLGGSVACDMPAAHLAHWQASTTAVAVQAFMQFAVAYAIVIVLYRQQYSRIDVACERYRQRQRAPAPPPALQELFSRGILHPKEPYRT